MGVRHNKILLAKYESHQRVMTPFTNFVDQVPDNEWPSSLSRIINYSNCPPSLLQIFPSFLRQLTTSGLTKHFGQVRDINNHLIRKLIDVLLRLRDFLGDEI